MELSIEDYLQNAEPDSDICCLVFWPWVSGQFNFDGMSRIERRQTVISAFSELKKNAFTLLEENGFIVTADMGMLPCAAVKGNVVKWRTVLDSLQISGITVRPNFEVTLEN